MRLSMYDSAALKPRREGNAMAAKRFPAGLRLFRSRQQDDHVVRIDPAEHAAGLLV